MWELETTVEEQAHISLPSQFTKPETKLSIKTRILKKMTTIKAKEITMEFRFYNCLLLY